MTNRHRNIQLLLGGYLHQDWSEEDGSPDAAVHQFAEREPVEIVDAAVEELEILLADESRDDLSFQKLTNDAGSYYDPTSEGRSTREWLTNVHRLLQMAVRRRNE